MEMPTEWANTFDGCFSQDAFVHAYSKEAGLREALRVTKPGGFLVLCDLHCGDGPGVSAEELRFAPAQSLSDRLCLPAPSLCFQGSGLER
jgi:sarcosine/dimethylglycine N-methyltransferase